MDIGIFLESFGLIRVDSVCFGLLRVDRGWYRLIWVDLGWFGLIQVDLCWFDCLWVSESVRLWFAAKKLKEGRWRNIVWINLLSSSWLETDANQAWEPRIVYGSSVRRIPHEQIQTKFNKSSFCSGSCNECHAKTKL